MKEHTAEYGDGEVELSGLLVWDDDVNAKRPGILVVHGGAGLDDHAKERARQFAELGLIALACDMYGRGVVGDRDRIVSAVTALRDDPARMVKRAQAGLDVLASHELVNGQLAAVGYCFGGLTVLQLARSGVDLAGVISVHGTLGTTIRARPGEIKAKVLVCHGALDPFVPPEQVAAFIEEMNAARAEWRMTVYGGAMHGFTHRTGPPSPGVAYDAAADAGSCAAIMTFLTEIFGGRLAVG